MITITEKNKSFIRIQFSDTDNEDFPKLIEHFSIKIPGIEHNPAYKMRLIDGYQYFIEIEEEMEDCAIMKAGLKSKLIEACKMFKIDYVDKTVIKDSNISLDTVKKFIEALDLKWTPYEHQITGVYNILKYESGIMLSGVGSGKSLIIYIVFRWCMFREKKGFLIVPSIGLTHQMYNDFKEYFEDKEHKLLDLIESEEDEFKVASHRAKLKKIYERRKKTNCTSIEDTVHLIFGGQDKNTNHPWKISTYQSLSMTENTMRVDPEYFNDVDVLIIDEAHKASSESLENIIDACDTAYIKCGLTGSLSDDLIANVTIEGLLGQVHQIITLSEMIDLGMATKVLVRPLFLKYPKTLVKEIRGISNFAQEVKLLRTQKPRIKFLAKILHRLKDENVLIVYKNTDVAISLIEELHKLRFPDEKFVRAEYHRINKRDMMIVGSSTKAEAREAFRKEMINGKGKLMIGVDTIVATGLNIPTINHIFLEDIGKSITLVKQAIGRGTRLSEGKELATIWDIVDDCRYYARTGTEYPNYKFKHFLERIEIYISEGVDVDDPKDIRLDYGEDSKADKYF